MKLLLDTHTIIWWLARPERLSPAAGRAIADPANEIAVSAVCGWEINTKARLGKWPEAAEVADGLEEEVAAQSFSLLDIRFEQACLAGRLAGAHRDPFDRMLAAQALIDELTIVSVDSALDAFGVSRLW